MYRDSRARSTPVNVGRDSIIVVLGPVEWFDYEYEYQGNMVSIRRTTMPLLTPAGILYLVTNSSTELMLMNYFEEF